MDLSPTEKNNRITAIMESLSSQIEAALWLANRNGSIRDKMLALMDKIKIARDAALEIRDEILYAPVDNGRNDWDFI